MPCKDLLSMEQLKDSLHLVAGEQGLGRSVRWIYFADCIECVKDQDNLAQWIHGGELVIVTNLHYLKSEERMLDMMRQFNRKTAAGFVVNVEEASDALRQLADGTSKPSICRRSFVLPWWKRRKMRRISAKSFQRYYIRLDFRQQMSCGRENIMGWNWKSRILWLRLTSII